MITRVSYLEEGGIAVELPRNPLRRIKGYIFGEGMPVLTVNSFGWINPEEYKHEEMILNYRGSFQDEINGDPPLVKLSTVKNCPDIGRDFYGLVSFQEIATSGDYYNRRVIGDFYFGENSNILVGYGEKSIIRRGYYHSFPVSKVTKIDEILNLKEICWGAIDIDKFGLPEDFLGFN
jgi:hypothetical protein